MITSRHTVFFNAPGQVEIRREPIEAPPPGGLLVRTLLSAVSPGTEMLIYRGEFPTGISLDENIASLSGGFSYPLKYGYCAVGRVLAIDKEVEAAWLDRIVFSFNPHQTHFIAPPEALIPLPADVVPEQALFLPNLETALNFVMDGRPLIGERVLVFGQGIVGLLTTALLARFPLSRLVTVDRYENRRQASLGQGAHASLDPGVPDFPHQARSALDGEADLCFEVSGAPAALDQAIALTGYDGRVIIGSWYGRKPLELDLGGRFHRSRIRLISSQVSSISPELSGRWDKARRFELAWQHIHRLQPDQLITHRFPFQEAAQAYRLIDLHPEQTIQVIFTYP